VQQCPEQVCFQVTATDNCSGNLSPTVTVNGTALSATGNQYCYLVTAAGNYTVQIIATDAAGNTTNRSFSIAASETTVQPTNLSCLSMANVTLGNSCQYTLQATNVLIRTLWLSDECGLRDHGHRCQPGQRPNHRRLRRVCVRGAPAPGRGERRLQHLLGHGPRRG
jgi:hypothetical protein